VTQTQVRVRSLVRLSTCPRVPLEFALGFEAVALPGAGHDYYVEHCAQQGRIRALAPTHLFRSRHRPEGAASDLKSEMSYERTNPVGASNPCFQANFTESGESGSLQVDPVRFRRRVALSISSPRNHKKQGPRARSRGPFTLCSEVGRGRQRQLGRIPPLGVMILLSRTSEEPSSWRRQRRLREPILTACSVSSPP
jgi:hypothetical protein